MGEQSVKIAPKFSLAFRFSFLLASKFTQLHLALSIPNRVEVCNFGNYFGLEQF